MNKTLAKNLSAIYIIIAGIFWGTSSLFVRSLGLFGMDSIQITCIRVISSGLFMSLFVLLTNKSLFKIKFRDIPIFIFSGVISIFLTSIFYFKTISLVSASVACVLMYTAPIFVLIFSFILFREKVTIRKIIVISLAVLGCAFISGVIGSGSIVSPAALFFGLLSGISYASYSIVGKFALKKYNPMTLTLYSFIFASVAALFVLDYGLTSALLTENKSLYLLFPLTGLSTSVIPYLLYSIGLKKLEPSLACVLSSVEPLVASLVSIFILSEAFTISNGIGIVLIIVSIAILK